ncbi:MAG TPA: hypothetical protein PK400_12165 [Phycisphaerales bacterium]|nr:hypothetical protein [Phycisphaerales bacterium]
MILYVACALLVGCAASQDSSSHALREMPPPRVISFSDDRMLREQVEKELGPEVAEAMPPVPRARPEPVDPGAERIAQSLAARITAIETERGSDISVSFGLVRNMSRAQASEFESLKSRLVSLLTHAGSESRLAFDSNDAEAPYQLHGSAYLITVGGIDMWELYLTLMPRGESWTLWEASHPIRVLRQPRPGQPNILVPNNFQ